MAGTAPPFPPGLDFGTGNSLQGGSSSAGSGQTQLGDLVAPVVSFGSGTASTVRTTPLGSVANNIPLYAGIAAVAFVAIVWLKKG